MGFWTPEKKLWYDRAVEVTGYGDRISNRIAARLPAGESVCDLGCGTGFLARRLALRGYQVTAVDRDIIGLGDLQKAPGVRVLVSSWDDLPGGLHWQNVVMLLTGNLKTKLADYLALADRRLILLVKQRAGSHMGRESARAPADFLSPESIADRLCQLGCRVQRESVEVEFGQPFLSREEAADYCRAWHGDETEVLARLVPGTGAYPLYLPIPRSFVLITAEKE